MKINFKLDLDIDDIKLYNSRAEILEFIKSLDLAMADVDFTLNLVNVLIDSLKIDMTAEEIKKNVFIKD